MISYIVVCRGWADGRRWPDYEGLYLEGYDPEFEDGKGKVKWTDDLNKAHRFESLEEIHKMWKVVPKCHPVRHTDGKPNRPLTAFNIEIIPCQDTASLN